MFKSYLVVIFSLGLLQAFGDALNVTNLMELSHHWLHHEMTPDELAAQFGLFDGKDVDSDSYRVITITNEYHFHKNEKRDGKSGHLKTLSLNAFGKKFQMPLKQSRNLLSPYAKIVDTYTDPRTGEISQRTISIVADPDQYPNQDCHFTHHSEDFLGAFSNCDGDGSLFRGFFADNDNIYEVHPLHARHQNKMRPIDKRDPEKVFYHIITKKDKAQFKLPENFGMAIPNESLSRVGDAKMKRAAKNKVVETALFMDKIAYDTYLRFFENDKQKIRNLILTFVNGIQAIYHYPLLKSFIDFTIVRIELMETQPFSTGGSERTQLLSNFCDYQGKLNPGDDSNPQHWDVGLYLSGLDFWAVEGGQRSTITMGLATVTGICTKEYGCVIGEIGVQNQEGRPYPSTGFTSVYVMAHEIGHNLGMTHDHTAGCDKDGYVMSFSRGTKGEVLWSRCSADVIEKLDMPCLTESSAPAPSAENDHFAKYKNVPGLIWSPVEQCQFLLQDKRAKLNHDPSNMPEMCDRLLCRLDEAGTTGYFAAGPALEGTACRNDSLTNNFFCVQGSCVERKDLQSLLTQAPEQNQIGTAKWNDWHNGPCYSGCITKGKGARTRRRTCQIPKPALSAVQCQGPTTDVQLCDDFTPCASGSVSASDYASEMCKAYQNTVSSLESDLSGEGKQPQHNPQRIEQACTIYCKATKSSDWYSPQLELSRYPDVDLFFPEGTWCHNDGKEDFYCQQHQCKTSSPRGGRAVGIPQISYMHNARPNEETEIPSILKDYFTLSADGKPKTIDPTVFNKQPMPEEEFDLGDDTITKDELERSAPEKRASDNSLPPNGSDKSFFILDHIAKEDVDERSAKL